MAVVQNTPTDTFDVGCSISDGLRTDVDNVMPRRDGHFLSWPPDSGIGHSSDGRTQGSGGSRFDQSTFRQSISQTPRRKRRAAGRMMTDSDMGFDVMPGGTQRGTPRKHYPTDTFDVGRSISDGLRTDVDNVMPRRDGHFLSWPPDSGIGHSSDGRTQGSGGSRFDQSTFRQSISQTPDGSEGLRAG